MKRRTFLQTVIGAILALLMPKANVPKKTSIAAHPMEIAYDIDIDYVESEQNPDGQLCLIYENPFGLGGSHPNLVTRIVCYEGDVPCQEGMLVYYSDSIHRTVVNAKWNPAFDGVVKMTPEELRKRYIEGPSFKGIPLLYEESLNA